MPIDLNLSFTIDENGLALTDDNGEPIAYVTASPVDPSVSGLDVPVGSLHLNTAAGTVFVKTSTNPTDWTQNTAVPELNQSNLLAFAAAHG